MESDPQSAEALLREALEADLFHGPAHNNLGVLALSRGDLYLAANEFAWAAKLLPDQPDPKHNLALTLERAGRTDEALAEYQRALEVRSGHIATMQAMTRLEIASNRPSEGTRDRLRTLALEGETPQWREWAGFELRKMNAGESR